MTRAKTNAEWQWAPIRCALLVSAYGIAPADCTLKKASTLLEARHLHLQHTACSNLHPKHSPPYCSPKTVRYLSFALPAHSAVVMVAGLPPRRIGITRGSVSAQHLAAAAEQGNAHVQDSCMWIAGYKQRACSRTPILFVIISTPMICSVLILPGQTQLDPSVCVDGCLPGNPSTLHYMFHMHVPLAHTGSRYTKTHP